ncbi:hypothetical protein chiPu_0030326, partial [Chiloscyllium punctatum]|nr:hypothetical protein [Chiloscyllium punctatum]
MVLELSQTIPLGKSTLIHRSVTLFQTFPDRRPHTFLALRVFFYSLFQRLESLLYTCRSSLAFLRNTSDQLEAKQLPDTAK